MQPARFRFRHIVLALLSVLSVVTYLDRVCIAVAGPRMQDSLHIGPKQWGWVTSVFFLSYSLFEIPAGALGDRLGPRKVLTRVVLWWSAFTSLTGAVSGYGMLLAVRFLFGIGEAGAYPNMSTVLARWVPSAQRARGWGIVFSTSQLGGALAPLIVLPIQMRFGWRAPFLVFGAAGVVWAIVWFVWFRDSPAAKPGITATELREIGDDSAAGDHRLPWGSALRNPAMWQIAGIGACYVYVMSFFWAWLQTYLVRGRGFSESALLLSSLPYLIGAAAAYGGGILSDWLVRRMGLRKGRCTLGAAALGLAAVCMGASVLVTNNVWALVLLSLSYTGILLQQPNVGAVVLDVGRRHAGGVFGFMNTAANAASSLSAVAFGYMVERFGSYNAPFIPMIAALAAGAILWMLIDPAKTIFGRGELSRVLEADR